MNPASVYQSCPARVDALVAARVQLLGGGQPLGAGGGRRRDAGLLEEVLAVDHDPVRGVPGNAVLVEALLPRFGETGQPVVPAPLRDGLQGQVEQSVAVDVLRDLGVAHLDDVRPVAVPGLQRGLHLAADAGPLLDADVEVEVRVVVFEVLGEPVQELLRRAVLHQPHRDRAGIGSPCPR
ncbi:hypothetical protein QF030_007028 [Streptomyces rishiriensis]|uniref:Uncharacterized protein n=1 Tax=Streptomyces rishiriensis TaxID=68264 RepID=A0ABU0P0E7_STRRH|nr:hypothetical protein [Streptomyces rishiriensis]